MTMVLAYSSYGRHFVDGSGGVGDVTVFGPFTIGLAGTSIAVAPTMDTVNAGVAPDTVVAGVAGTQVAATPSGPNIGVTATPSSIVVQG